MGSVISCCGIYCDSGVTPKNSGPSLYCTFMSDTAGVLYRAFAPAYGYVVGKNVDRIDPWTENILKCYERQSLIQAGANPLDAARQATDDVSEAQQANQAKSSCVSSWSLTTWILVIGAAAIVLIVGVNAFVSKEL